MAVSVGGGDAVDGDADTDDVACDDYDDDDGDGGGGREGETSLSRDSTGSNNRRGWESFEFDS